jgi:hypothetical protein
MSLQQARMPTGVLFVCVCVCDWKVMSNPVLTAITSEYPKTYRNEFVFIYVTYYPGHVLA